MADLNLNELRKVAEVTFPCEEWAIWTDVKDGGYVHVGNAQGVIPDGEFTTPDDAEPNLVAKAMTPDLGAHIATFDPPTVLALLDRVAELEAKVGRVEALADQWSFPVSLSHDDHWYASRLRAALAGESDE